MERKSGFQKNWATPRSKIMIPKVVKICESMGALMMRTITNWYSSTPNANSMSTVSGRV